MEFPILDRYRVFETTLTSRNLTILSTTTTNSFHYYKFVNTLLYQINQFLSNFIFASIFAFVVETRILCPNPFLVSLLTPPSEPRQLSKCKIAFCPNY